MQKNQKKKKKVQRTTECNYRRVYHIVSWERLKFLIKLTPSTRGCHPTFPWGTTLRFQDLCDPHGWHIRDTSRQTIPTTTVGSVLRSRSHDTYRRHRRFLTTSETSIIVDSRRTTEKESDPFKTDSPSENLDAGRHPDENNRHQTTHRRHLVDTPTPNFIPVRTSLMSRP